MIWNPRSRMVSAIVTALVVCTMSAQAQRSWRTERVKIEDLDKVEAVQQTQLWCWAACIEMVFAAANIDVEQADIVQSVKGGIVVQGASNAEISYALNRSYTTPDGQDVDLQCTELRTPPVIPLINELAAGRPVILAYSTGPYSGHVVIAVDAEFVHDPQQGPSITKLVIYDPWTGRTRSYDPRSVPYTITSSWFTFIEGAEDQESFRIDLPQSYDEAPRIWYRVWLDRKFAGYLGTHAIQNMMGPSIPVRTMVLPELEGEVRYKISCDISDINNWGTLQYVTSVSGSGTIDLDESSQFEIYTTPDRKPGIRPEW